MAEGLILWTEIANQRGIRCAAATFQTIIALVGFGSIAFGSPPKLFTEVASLLPPFSIGDFSTATLLLGVCVHLALIIAFGISFWAYTLGLAAQLAALLFFVGITFQALVEILVLALHNLHLDYWGLAETYLHYKSGGESLFVVTILQQPLKISIVLPSFLACLIAIRNLISVARFEDIVVLRLHQTSGAILCGCFLFFRVFNHISHVVAPMTAQVLREERFAPNLRSELSKGYRLFFLAEASVHRAKTIFSRLGRIICGVILLSMEHVPLWTSEIVDLLLEGRET